MVSVVESIIEKSFRDGGKIHRSPAIIGLAQNGFSEEFISAQRERAIAHDVVSVFREAIEHSGPSRDPEDVLRYLREHEHMSLDRIQSDPLVSWGVDEMHQEFIQQRFLSIRRLADEIERGGYSVKQLRDLDAESLVEEIVSKTTSPQDAVDIIERSHLDRGTSHIAGLAMDRALDQRYRQEHDDQVGSNAPLEGMKHEVLGSLEASAKRPISVGHDDLSVEEPLPTAPPEPLGSRSQVKQDKKKMNEVTAYAAPVMVMTMGGGRLGHDEVLAMPEDSAPAGDESFYEGGSRLGSDIVATLRTVEHRLGVNGIPDYNHESEVSAVSRALQKRNERTPERGVHEFTPPDNMNAFGVGGDGIGTPVKKIERTVEEYSKYDQPDL
jgi:hypothetical protein